MNSKLVLLTFLEDGIPGLTPGYPLPTPPVDPGFGQGRPPVDPGYGRPSGGRPDQGLPGYGRPDQGLPGFSGHPDNALPGGGYPSGQPVPLPPVTPDNTLPPHSPTPTISLPVVLTTPIDPDRYFEMKYSAAYGWVLVPVEDDAEPK